MTLTPKKNDTDEYFQYSLGDCKDNIQSLHTMKTLNFFV